MEQKICQSLRYFNILVPNVNNQVCLKKITKEYRFRHNPLCGVSKHITWHSIIARSRIFYAYFHYTRNVNIKSFLLSCCKFFICSVPLHQTKYKFPPN